MPIEVKQPEKIVSIDMLDYCHRIDRFLNELQSCVSATRNESTEADVDRWIALHGDMKRKLDIYIGDKQKKELDVPNYHPNKQTLPAVPVLEDRQNPDVMNITRTLVTIRTQAVVGEESERVSGLSTDQANRHERMLDRLKEVLDDIKDNREVDSPNSPDQKPGDTKK